MSGTTPNPLTSHAWSGVAAWHFNLKAEIASYESARAFVRDNDPDHVCAELGPHMRVILLGDGHDFAEDVYAVELYDTEIIRYYPDESFSVDCDGFTTSTTRERLQAVVPAGYRVYFHASQLGLTYDRAGIGWARRRKVQPAGTLWPLDHSVRIDAETGRVVT